MRNIAAQGLTGVVMRPEGRQLQYTEFGDPRGMPVFYAHGTPGSRLEGLHFDHTAHRFGIRLICPDRPGIGGSDYCEHYNLLDFPRDVGFIADRLGIEQFGVLGWSSGGPHALTCAFEMPERLRFVVVMAGYTNFAEYEDARQLLWTNDQMAPTIAMKSRFLFRTLLGMMRMAERHVPRLYLDFIRRSSSGRDLEILRQPAILQDFMRSQDEAFRQGIDGILRDLLVEYIDWGYRLADIHFPIHLFQGRQDHFVPWQFADHLARNLASSQVEYLESEGHLFPLDPAWQRGLWMKVRGL